MASFGIDGTTGISAQPESAGGSNLGTVVATLLRPTAPAAAVDFSGPPGEPALLAPDSISWLVFKNPLTLFIGGVAAVILQLAEPRVRGGWNHTRLHSDPVSRLRGTAHAAMISIYGPRSAAEAMIANVRRLHGTVKGVTPDGESYAADDPELLNWVQATMSFGMAAAHRAYAGRLWESDLELFQAEHAAIGRLFGATAAPSSIAEREALFDAMRGRLEPTEAIFSLLDILRQAPLLPPTIRSLQGLMVRGAIEVIPAALRGRLRLGRRYGLWPGGTTALRHLARRVGRLTLDSAPPVEACRRLGLGVDYLNRHESPGRRLPK